MQATFIYDAANAKSGGGSGDGGEDQAGGDGASSDDESFDIDNDGSSSPTVQCVHQGPNSDAGDDEDDSIADNNCGFFGGDDAQVSTDGAGVYEIMFHAGSVNSSSSGMDHGNPDLEL